MQYLESDSSNLETYSVMNRKPVEISKNRRNVAKARFLGNDPSKCVLNKLQASQIRNRCASKERFTVIKSRTHYRRSNCLASLSGEGRSFQTIDHRMSMLTGSVLSCLNLWWCQGAKNLLW